MKGALGCTVSLGHVALVGSAFSLSVVLRFSPLPHALHASQSMRQWLHHRIACLSFPAIWVTPGVLPLFNLTSTHAPPLTSHLLVLSLPPPLLTFISPSPWRRRGHYQECYDLTSAALERDPYALECLPAHLASALELRKKNDLFMRAHK